MVLVVFPERPERCPEWLARYRAVGHVNVSPGGTQRNQLAQDRRRNFSAGENKLCVGFLLLSCDDTLDSTMRKADVALVSVMRGRPVLGSQLMCQLENHSGFFIFNEIRHFQSPELVKKNKGDPINSDHPPRLLWQRVPRPLHLEKCKISLLPLSKREGM